MLDIRPVMSSGLQDKACWGAAQKPKTDKPKSDQPKVRPETLGTPDGRVCWFS